LTAIIAIMMSDANRERQLWSSLNRNPSLLEAEANSILEQLIDDAILGQAFEIHRSIKTGLYFISDPDFGEDSNDSTNNNSNDGSVASGSNMGGGAGGGSGASSVSGSAALLTDVFGQAVTTTSGVPALKKQCECVCPNCQRNLAASRFAPHLEKCMGMGRNSSRIASRRLANSNKDKDQQGSGGAGSYREDDREDDEDEEWIEPSKAVSSNRRKRDKNSPRRNRGGGGGGSSSGRGASSSTYEYDTHSGVQTPPLGYEAMSMDERSSLLSNVCGVISSNSRKICMRTTKCPFHTDAQRREIRIRWLSNDEETVDIDSFTEGDTATLRESLAQLSNASSPAESTISTSSNPSANSSLRGVGTSGRREKGRRGNKKGKQPGSKGGSRGSTPPLPMME